MKYILGVDSGGTKYQVRAMALDGTLLAEHIGAPCRHYEIGEEETLHRIEQSMADCLRLFGGRREDCVAIAAGVSGIDSEEEEVILHRIYNNLAGFVCPVRCLNDGEMTHYTVNGGTGVLVIAGTGAIAFGRSSRGESIRVGVWGSAIVKSRLHLESFTRLVKTKYPEAKVLLPEKEAVDGACMMALELAR